MRFETQNRPEVTSTPSRLHDGDSCCSSTRTKTDPRPPGSNTWKHAQKHTIKAASGDRIQLNNSFYSLTWNSLSAERRRGEGGELLLSSNTVRPFSLAAGLERTERGGLNTRGKMCWATGCGGYFLCCVCSHKHSCTFGPDGFENNKNKK